MVDELIGCQELTSGYEGMPVVRDVTMGVGKATITGLLGRNGAGKSTLLKTLLGYIKPTKGRSVVDGRDVSGWPASRIATLGVSYVPEESRIFGDLTLSENIQLGTMRSGAWATLDQLPPQVRSILQRGWDVKASHLSGGEQQIVGLARALLSSPRLLIIDELSAGLQPSIVGEFIGYLKRINNERGVTVILVEQSLPIVVEMCDDYLLLEKGSITARGDRGSLRRDEKKLKELLAL